MIVHKWVLKMTVALVLIFTCHSGWSAEKNDSNFANTVTPKQMKKIEKFLKEKGLNSSDFRGLDLWDCHRDPDDYSEGIFGVARRKMKITEVLVPEDASVTFCQNNIKSVYAQKDQIVEVNGLHCKGNFKPYEDPADPLNKRKLFECRLGGNSKYNGFNIPSGANVRFKWMGEICFWFDKDLSKKSMSYKKYDYYKIINGEAVKIDPLKDVDFCGLR